MTIAPVRGRERGRSHCPPYGIDFVDQQTQASDHAGAGKNPDSLYERNQAVGGRKFGAFVGAVARPIGTGLGGESNEPAGD